jgi:signal transduction histidine kinase
MGAGRLPTTSRGRNLGVLPPEDTDPPSGRLRAGAAPLPSSEEMRRRQLLLDAPIAAAIFAFGLAATGHKAFEHADRDLDALGVVLVALASLPLAARRRAPLPVFVTVTAATSALYGFRYGLGPPIGFAVALYTVAETRDETRPRIWTGTLVGSLLVLLGPHVIRGEWAPELLLGAVVWAAAWFAGDRARLRRERLAELEERARRAERDAERERRLAAAEERTRIARDLHDSAGHAINVILVQAGAARLLREKDPERSRQALETIEDVARDTLGEIDQLVRALRENGSGTAVEPPPGLAALDTLAERHRASGLALTVSTEGSQRALAPGVDQAAYRILQEALTNAARHGDGSADVRVAFASDGLALTVTNVARESGDTGGGSNGIVGMRERASLLGGSLEAGALDGVFRVHARLPYGGDE